VSGSPIIHVLVDDPTKEYAIFAENMLETAQSVAENNKLKKYYKKRPKTLFLVFGRNL
jgi:hypothetical protein